MRGAKFRSDHSKHSESRGRPASAKGTKFKGKRKKKKRKAKMVTGNEMNSRSSNEEQSEMITVKAIWM